VVTEGGFTVPRGKSYSVIIVPSDHSGTRQFRVSRVSVLGTIAVAVLFAAVILGFVATYARVLDRARSVPGLEQQNRELLTEVESVQELGRMMEDLNAMRAQVLAMLGSSDDTELGEMEPLKAQTEIENDPFEDPTRLHEVFADAARRPFAPTAWPLPGRVTREFIPGADGDNPPHPGLSIDGEPTSDVEAAGRGRVVDIGENSDGEPYVTIDHGYGFQTYYCGLRDVRVVLGQVVEQGSWIGRATGLRASHGGGSGLYFEIHVDGIPADPRRYLSSR
jgi:murein DD-endopeptidase MepM/ murein hydrolase activator NlpD